MDLSLIQLDRPFPYYNWKLSDKWFIKMDCISFTNEGQTGTYDAIVFSRLTESKDKAEKKTWHSINIPLRYIDALKTAINRMKAGNETGTLHSVADLQDHMKKHGEYLGEMFHTDISSCCSNELPRLGFKIAPQLYVKSETVEYGKSTFDVLTITREAKSTKKPFSLSLPASHLGRVQVVVNLVSELYDEFTRS